MRPRHRPRPRGFTLAEVLNFLGLAAILAALGMYGLARYLKYSKASEGVGSTTAVAQAAANYYNGSDAKQPAGTKPDSAKAMRHFPASSRTSVPTDFNDVKGKRYQSGIGDWSVSPWLDMGFSLSTPQFYAYSFESQGSGPSALATAEARGDLDGNGVNSTFRVSVSPDATGTAKVDPNVVRVDPEE
ncbi:hypothetical protein BH09MYX1_BH09MYX1_62330 [soil metagenome]